MPEDKRYSADDVVKIRREYCPKLGYKFLDENPNQWVPQSDGFNTTLVLFSDDTLVCSYCRIFVTCYRGSI